MDVPKTKFGEGKMTDEEKKIIIAWLKSLKTEQSRDAMIDDINHNVLRALAGSLIAPPSNWKTKATIEAVKKAIKNESPVA